MAILFVCDRIGFQILSCITDKSYISVILVLQIQHPLAAFSFFLFCLRLAFLLFICPNQLFYLCVFAAILFSGFFPYSILLVLNILFPICFSYIYRHSFFSSVFPAPLIFSILFLLIFCQLFLYSYFLPLMLKVFRCLNRPWSFVINGGV